MNEQYRKWFDAVGIYGEDADKVYEMAKVCASLSNNRSTDISEFRLKMPPMPPDVSGNAGLWFGYVMGFVSGIKYNDEVE